MQVTDHPSKVCRKIHVISHDHISITSASIGDELFDGLISRNPPGRQFTKEAECAGELRVRFDAPQVNMRRRVNS